MKRLLTLCFWFNFFLTSFGQPLQWHASGLGGGGALYAPSISPFNSSEYYLTCDMSDIFHTTDQGENWETVPFHQLTGASIYSKVNFTSSPDTLYCFGFTGYPNPYEPLISADGGNSWNTLVQDPTYGEVAYLFADPNRTDRILIADYSNLYLSNDAGHQFQSVYQTNNGNGIHLGGVFWDDESIYLGTNLGLLVSTDNGNSFSLENYSDDLSSNYGMLSFAGAKTDAQPVFYCVAKPAQDIWGGYHPRDYWSNEAEVYRLDYGSTAGWEIKNNGIPSSDFPYYVAMSANNTSTAYLAGYTQSTYSQMVYKTESNGENWTAVFHTSNNQNIETGWMGHQGDLSWGWAENTFGLDVAPQNPDVVLISDWGFAHTTRNGGTDWQQVYANPADGNPSGSATPTGAQYRSNGLEVTSAWWLTWSDPDNLFASYTDITGIRSSDGGESWGFDYAYPQDYNSTYQVIQHPDNGTLYAAVSSVHDIYQSTYLTDASLDGGSGEVFFSSDQGENWSRLYDFGHPVIWLAIDEHQPDNLYASVIHSTQGGIFASTDGGSSWSKRSNPPRTEGHPFNIHILEDGTLVCSYSGRRNASGAFTTGSGVFVSTDNGQSWEDRSHADMVRWTKDIIIDPHDLNQNTWYACIHSHWGSAPNEVGGVFRTTDRGITWERINDLYRVHSLTVHPNDPNLAYVTTTAGLYFTENLRASNPTFDLLPEYPFAQPMRVFFNPYDPDEVWVTSFGNGMKKGTTVSTQIDGVEQHDLQVFPNPTSGKAWIQSERHVVHWQLMDIQGRLIQSMNPQTPLEIHTNECAKGNYILRIQTEKTAQTLKITVR